MLLVPPSVGSNTRRVAAIGPTQIHTSYRVPVPARRPAVVIGVALTLWTVVVGGAPRAADAQVKPPTPPALCSLASEADLAAATQGPRPLVFGTVTTGNAALRKLAAQSELALGPIVRSASSVTTCRMIIIRNAATFGSTPSQMFHDPTLTLSFYNRVSRGSFRVERHAFEVDGTSTVGGTGVRSAVTDLPGIGDRAFSLGVQPPTHPGGMSTYELIALVGSTQLRVHLSAAAPDPARVQTLARLLAHRLR